MWKKPFFLASVVKEAVIYQQLDTPQSCCQREVAMADNSTIEAKICEPGGGGLWLPLGGDAEAIPLYLVALLYCFLGVAIIADVFMSAIEKVTSVKKQVMSKDGGGKKVTVKVWNDTVANLTLMALGSSAPEILWAVPAPQQAVVFTKSRVGG
eukprot:Skav213842  [mRNA]  locus=scaffold315:319783:330023:+ [translate_table: standard]